METKIIKSLPLFLLLLLLLGCVYYDTEDGGIKIAISGVSVDDKI